MCIVKKSRTVRRTVGAVEDTVRLKRKDEITTESALMALVKQF